MAGLAQHHDCSAIFLGGAVVAVIVASLGAVACHCYGAAGEMPIEPPA